MDGGRHARAPFQKIRFSNRTTPLPGGRNLGRRGNSCRTLRAGEQPAAQAEARVIVVGEGSVQVAPDYAQIRGGVTTKGKTVKEATDANSKLMAAVTAALLNAGIAQADIQTAQFSIQPVYAPPQPQAEPKLVGYNVSNQVTVTVRALGKVSEILDRMVDAGVTDVGNVAFLHLDSAKALDQAREAAVADARRKAELYARAAGFTLGRVAWFTEGSGLMPSVRRRCSAPRRAWRRRCRSRPAKILAGADHGWLRHRQLVHDPEKWIPVFRKIMHELSDRRRLHLDLLVLDHAADGGPLEHAVLERGVVLELAHRQLAAHAPGVEDEAVGIEHGIFVGKPFAPGQHAVDLLQIAVEGLAGRSP